MAWSGGGNTGGFTQKTGVFGGVFSRDFQENLKV
jgi:hypothetical protein